MTRWPGARWRFLRSSVRLETIPARFTDKELFAFSGQGRVPVIRDGDTVVSDSWTIAEYLEKEYPAAPSLFGGMPLNAAGYNV